MSNMSRAGLLLASGVAFFSLGQAAHAQRVSTVTGKTLGTMCSQKKGVALCDAYLSGVMDSEVWSHDYAALNHDGAPTAFCVPKEQKTPQVRNVVVAWLGAHTDALSQPAGKGVYRALHENYPCGSTMTAPAATSGGKK
ncbi:MULTISPECIES: Rap1a/Tai family immunity protein [unclassified Saccharibacter]|uniref:Rap1a/Tai family immunity protein n=1 Tax=unclassified Saccharibacter TaxID=2648722 RepID=UPI0013212CEB|nr:MULTISPECIES: Rap1a/Tai family immunity protein [unclassified Saccharibacter]MXV36319.1 hypothetical protein [Saccharibacter sp. EH611]MXV57178.1 hypothetical protein [Saccharibacter sp. EH70]MXV66462.1 hypothetical protein [Saccharibacter sp. EH60]